MAIVRSDGELRALLAAHALEPLEITRRDWRWLVRLDEERMLLVPVDERGAERLARERRLLATIAPRLSFAIPRPIGPLDGALDLRTRIRGSTGAHLHRPLVEDPARAAAYADDLARLLAELHGALASDELDALGGDPDLDSYPLPPATLQAVVPSLPSEIRARVSAALARWAALGDDDPVLTHGDLGTHNLVFDPDTSRVVGVFDFEELARRDRHHDFKYLPSYGPRVTARVLERYRELTGVDLSLERIRLLHLATALSFWAWRERDPVAHDRDSGRDRDQALAWVGLAAFAL